VGLGSVSRDTTWIKEREGGYWRGLWGWCDRWCRSVGLCLVPLDIDGLLVEQVISGPSLRPVNRCAKLSRMTNRRTSSDGRQAPGSWRARSASYALGAAGGLGVNQLSTDYGDRGLAAAAALAAILFSTNWLRKPPPTAPLTRIVPQALLGGAAIATVVAVANSNWEGRATIATTVFTISAFADPH
jgi:hypothetical protein